MTAVSVETDLSVLFDWSLSCEMGYKGLCPSDTHDADLTVRTQCPGCACTFVALTCDRFRDMMKMYLEGPGVECLKCQTPFSVEDFVWEPLR